MKESLSQAPQTPTPGGILVSVLVPVYNSKTSLLKCLNTLAAQDCQNIEFICVDDGSTDSSGDILEQQAAKDARFRVIHQANGGYGKAMNTGLDAAKGSYIGIVEPDDWVESDMFSRLLKLAQESQADIAKANYCIERKNLSRPNKKFDNQEEGSCHAPADLPEYMLGAPSIWTAIYLADWLKENNIRFAETPGASFQDLGFCVRTWLAARKIAITHYAPYHYWEDNPVSSSRKLEDGAWAAFKELSSLGEYFSRIPQRCSSVRNSLVMRIFATMRADYRLRIRQTSKSFLLKYSHLLNNFFPLETLNPAAFTKNEWHDLQLVYQTPLLFPRKSKTRVNFLQRLLSCREEAGYRVIRVLGMTFMMNRKSTAEPSVSKLSDNDLPYDLTVATVCWNALQFLPRCIESVQPLYKSSLSVEHLFIDGASTDGTVEYLQQQLKEGRITRLISEPDKGLYDAMNKAIRNARGKVIVFINADDAICPEGTPACCAPILEGRAEYTAGQALCISSTSGKTSIIYPRIKKALWRQPYCHQSMFCSTKLLRRVGGFASEKFRIGADTELMRRLYINHVPYEAVNKISAHFYTGGVSYSPAVRTEVYDLMMHFTDAYCHEASIHPGSAIITLKHLRRYTTRKLLQQDGCSTLDAAHREQLGTFVSKLAQALPSGSRAMLRLHQRLLIAWYGFNSIFSSSKNRATNQLHKEITELFVSHLYPPYPALQSRLAHPMASSLTNLLSKFCAPLYRKVKRIRVKGKNNILSFQGELVKSKTTISGSDNSIHLGAGGMLARSTIRIDGNNNSIHISEGCRLLNATIIVNGEGCRVSIGQNTMASGPGSLYIICMGNGNYVNIGEDCMFADVVEIWASDTHPILDKENKLLNPSKPVSIGNHVWLGRYVKVLKGVTIGDGAVVGMDSLVTRDIQPGTLNAGSPTRCLKEHIQWEKGFITPYELNTPAPLNQA